MRSSLPLLALLLVAADSPPRDRMLSGADAGRVAALVEKRTRAFEANDLPGAIAAADGLVKLRESIQGADHWEAADARLEAADARWTRDATAQARAARWAAHEASAEGYRLERESRFAESEAAYDRADRGLAPLLPEAHPQRLYALDRLAAVRMNRGRHDGAEEAFRECLRRARAHLPPDHPRVADALLGLADVANHRRDLRRAEAEFRAALAILRRVYPDVHPRVAGALAGVGDTLLWQVRLPEAEIAFREAIRASPPDLRPPVGLTGLANTLGRLGRLSESEAAHRECLEHQRAVWNPWDRYIAVSLNDLAITVAWQGRHDEADRLYREAIAVYEASRLFAAPGGAGRAEFAQVAAAPALLLALSRASRGLAEPAWEAAEAQFARGLLDDLTEGPTLLERESHRLLTERLSDPKVDANERARLGADLVSLASRQAARRIVPLDRVRAALKADEALVFWLDLYTIGIEEHFGCVVRREGPPRWERPPNRKWEAVDWATSPGLCRAAADPAAPDLAAATAALRGQRFAPLQSHLQGVRRAFVIPSDRMAAVPVEALGLPFAVSYTPSASVFARTRERHRPLGRTALVLADPAADGYAALPGARAEAAALLGLLPDARTLLGADASLSAVRSLAAAGDLARFRLLHLAAHGEADAGSPDRCALALAGGRLTAGEIGTWSLDADMAVLSACQSGLGRSVNGEGMLGFAHTLLGRGTRTVVLSLWKVDDGATALLMGRFYANLFERRMGRAAALDESKAWLRTLTRAEASAGLRGSVERLKPVGPAAPATTDRPYAHPFFWAAFVLMGDPD